MATATHTKSPGAAGPSFGRLARRPEAGSFLGMIAVFLFFLSVSGQIFVSAPGFASWLNVAAEIGIVALPIGLLMIAGELDLSIGAVIPAASLTAAVVSGYYGLPDIVGIIAALAVGLAVGFVNGLLVIRTGVPSLIITIGMMFAVMGLTLGLSVLLTGSTSTSINPGPVAKTLLGAFIGGMFQVTIFWWIGFALVIGYLLHVSPWGNWIYALGGDKISARNAGIPTEKLTIGLFMLSGLAAAFVGTGQAMVYQSAQVAGGQSFIFNSIMCVVIGGVLLTGGFGSVVGIVLGTVTFAMVNQGIYFTGFDANLGSVIIGALLLVAVLMNDTFRQLALTYSTKKKG
ncbi:ABC transporter permease [Pseudooceanicola sp. CBS1P-1]|uniref:Xylose transport system permease protein XylH n=1 Tax=Pseudooceanicola albus TaxID=2692189 RepID=A0A6L7G7Q6_9RHOB|nr:MULTISPECIES: ABC transporter permease [Pseudooceanicola]MBT9386817.1 ABC transporter permease [Pseudooceanicola endophyticus]MXN19360.1 ABC transporter permease [Pseudooceanicola albus]